MNKNGNKKASAGKVDAFEYFIRERNYSVMILFAPMYLFT